MKPLPKLLVDVGPLAAFFIAFTKWDIFVATGVFMVATLVSLGVSYGVERRIARMPLITAIVVMLFGGLTLALADETFIKLKPTIVYLIFAVILSAGHLTGRSLLKPLFEMAFQLTEAGWRTLTLRSAGFFVVMAALNEIVWRNLSTDVWVNVKVFGFLPLTLVFFFAQMPLIRRTMLREDAAP